MLFPDGEPTPDDIGRTQLTNDGKFIIYKELTPQQQVDDDKVPTPQLTDWKVSDHDNSDYTIFVCISTV